MTRPPQTLPQIPAHKDAPAEGDCRWFDAGVRFRCFGPECGECCSGKHGPGAVWLAEEEIERLASHLGLTAGELRHRYLRRIFGRISLRERANFDCVFYRPGEGCSVYEARPLQCRAYPFWGRILASRTTWEKEAAYCPGIGEDDAPVPGEEVRRQLTGDCSSGEAPAPRSRRGKAP